MKYNQHVYPTWVFHWESDSSWQFSTSPHCADLPTGWGCLSKCLTVNQHVSSHVSKVKWFQLHHARSLPKSLAQGVSILQCQPPPKTSFWSQRAGSSLLIQFFSFIHSPAESCHTHHTTLGPEGKDISDRCPRRSRRTPEQGASLHADLLPNCRFMWLTPWFF